MTNRLATYTLLLLASLPMAGHSNTPGFTDTQYQEQLDGTWRSPENRARDPQRHPVETLRFFGLQPGQTVIEITPGNGWYSEILAPLLHDNGHYVAAIYSPDTSDYMRKTKASLVGKYSADSGRYGKTAVIEFRAAAPVFGPPGSADLVLTFRNVHNWLVAGNAPAMFKGFHDVLKPGGVLGVVDHRAAADAGDDKSGYVSVDKVIALAVTAGFKLDAQSEINANPKDTKDYPEGVWTLPPTLKLGAVDKDRYLAVGESDRMTLRFLKVR